jgi:hypothetical protein
MAAVLGTSWPVFLGLTVVLFGGAAYLTGQALAATWRPAWQALPYSLLLGLGERFLVFALFQGELLAPWGYVVHSLVIYLFCLLGFRLTRAERLTAQYPWLYERRGLLGWRRIP